MAAIQELLCGIRDVLSAAGAAVYMGFDHTPLEGRTPVRYLVLQTGGISTEKPYVTSRGRIYPMDITVSLVLLDQPDASAEALADYFESSVLGALLDAGYSPVRIKLCPVQYERTYDKLCLRAELVLGCGYKREAETE